MSRRWTCFLATLTLAAFPARADEPPIVAVLPLNVALAQMDDASRMTLEEDIRSVAGDRLTPLGYTVLTGENTLRVLSDNGVDATKACEASCALDAARELKAAYFLSGTVAKSEGTYVAFIRLFEQKRGQQLASVKLEGDRVRDLRQQLERNADRLFAHMPRLTAALAVAAAPAPASAPAAPPSSSHPVVVMKTSLGDVTLELDREKAPRTVDNFLTYVREGFYRGTIFHRVIDGFMIQGGGYTASLAEKPTHPPVKNEAANGLSNKRGTIAVARLPDPDSGTSQFFINVVDNPMLNFPANGGYAVFGRVTAGMDVVDRIKGVHTHRADNGMTNVPETPVVIKSVALQGATP